MNKQVTTNKQSGFSLVELMVVVAIIGILATLSVGSIQKQVAKSRQAEATTNLSALFSAEAAFHGEFGWYYTNLVSIKFSPEGNVRYNLGFGNTATPVNGTTFGYTGSGSALPGTSVNTCVTGANPVCTIANATCNCLNLATMVPVDPTGPGALPAKVVIGAASLGAVQNEFVAGATMFRLFQANNDSWVIDNNKTLSNNQDGIQ